MRITDTRQVTIGGHDFWIHPFSAMTAANISGDVIKIAMPILGDLIRAYSGGVTLDSDLSAAANVIGSGFSALNGDELEGLFRRLLIDKKNIAVDYGNEQGIWLTEAILNDWFIGDIVDMYLLAWEVIKVNFGDFFGRLFRGSPSGSASRTPGKAVMN